MSLCQCSQPGHCPLWGRHVAWGDIQSCRSNGPVKTQASGPTGPCRYKGLPLLDEHGFQRHRLNGCGCGTASRKVGLYQCGHPGYQLEAEDNCEARCPARRA